MQLYSICSFLNVGSNSHFSTLFQVPHYSIDIKYVCTPSSACMNLSTFLQLLLYKNGLLYYSISMGPFSLGTPSAYQIGTGI